VLAPAIDVAGAWAEAAVPVLALHGEYDEGTFAADGDAALDFLLRVS
jgi:hypothetical protein